MEFDRSEEDYVERAALSEVSKNTSWSISAWVMADTITSGNENTIWENAVSSSDLVGFQMRDDEFKLGAFNGSSYFTTKGAAASAGTWYHTIVTYDGSTVYLWLNGVEETSAASANPNLSTNSAFAVGCRSHPTSECDAFEGIIDEVRVLDVQLSDADILTQHNMSVDNGSFLSIGSEKAEADSLILQDSSGQGNDSTTAIVPIQPGVIGQSLSFNGVDDVVEIEATNDTLDTPNALTAAAWIRMDSYDSGTSQYILDKNLSFELRVQNTTQDIHARLYGLTDGFISGTGETIEVGQWYHVAVTWDGSTARTYVNGAQDLEEGQTGTLTTNDESLFIGADEGDPMDEFFHGDIDDVRVYDRALSADEIQRLYKLGATTKVNTTVNTQPTLESGLVGHWTMDGPDIDLGQVTAEVRDRSRQGNHGDWTNHSSTTAPGKISQALEFDGTDDRASIADSADWDIASAPATIALWFKPGRLQNQALIDFISGSGWTLETGEGGQRMEFKHSGTEQCLLIGPSTLETDRWYHLAAVLDGAGNCELFIDTVSVDTDTYSGLTNSDQSTLEIGGNELGGDDFQGILDDVRIYKNHALSQDEITRLYQLGGTAKVNITINTQPNLETGLVGHWTFDGKDMDFAQSSAEVRDRSGQDNHGNNDGGTVAPGRIGQALTFDGTDDHILVADPPGGQLDFGVNSFSYGLWARFDTDGNSPSEFQLPFEKGGSTANTAGYDFEYAQEFIALGACISDGFGSGVRCNDHEYEYRDGQWYHFMAVVDRTSDILSLYVDGTPVGSPTDISGYGSVSSSNNLHIENGSGGHYTDGLIDDVRVYNRALSADEVTQLYKLGAN